MKNTTLWIEKWQIASIEKIIEGIVKKTPAFVGVTLEPTGEERRAYWARTTEGALYHDDAFEYEIVSSKWDHTEIPGHRLVGRCENTAGTDSWVLSRLDADFEYTEELADMLDPRRCDICGVRQWRRYLWILIDTTVDEDAPLDERTVVVGGACAKKFNGVDLVSLFKSIILFRREFSTVWEDESDKGGGFGQVQFSLARKIALAEVLISRYGFHKSDSDDPTKNRLSEILYGGSDVFRHPGSGELTSLGQLLKDNSEKIAHRVNELRDTDFGFLNGIFLAQQKRRWSEFSNNCLAWLAGRKAPDGVAAYFASLLIKDEPQKQDNQLRATHAFEPAAGINKMTEFGTFKVLDTKARSNEFGESIGITCVDEQGAKLWFAVGDSTKAGQAYYDAFGNDMVSERDNVWLTLRGKVTGVKPQISFAKNVSFQKIEKRG